MFCRKCGKELGNSDAFCGACGQPANLAVSVKTPVTNTSATKVAVGVFLGIIAAAIALSAYANVGGITSVCAALALLAIFVAVGGLGKHLR
jgi:VIT1/CCC1 family predicted Fe2+/Mn2+ transporter